MPPRRLLAGLAVASLLLVACGDDADDPADDTTTTTDAGSPDTSEATDGGGAEAPSGSVEGVTVEGEFGEAATITVADDVEAPTELVVEDLIVGEGDVVPEGATVTIHYAGVLLDGTEFDASFGGPPATFPLARLIQGWQQGIPGMREGGRRLLAVPSELAYGPQGQGPIGPDEPLLFVVDVIEVVG